MYFRQIEMIGFKSFADRTLVNLESGMTAIVGPNGCGKSNILDAMRWALGEQSAKALRGAHMQDVIFNGSELRAPTGMAEVTLTFDNSDNVLPLDFSEVQVSRRVYRSGESEYLINKAPCRLRDVQELFMDTGIGTNAYSMIGQGKIDLVLSSKPEDRRFLFEEAAGIIKYKSRKRVAMRKLEQAEQNLLRLNDIVAEVERQMRSLKRQVNAAIRYRELKEQLQQLEVRAAWLKHVYLSAAIADLKQRFKAAQDAFEKYSVDTSRLEARFEELNLNKLEIDRVLHARREGVHEIDSEMEKIERQIALIRQQIEFSGEQQKRAAAEREAYLQAAESIKGQQTDAVERAEQLRLRMDVAREAMAAKQSEHDQAAIRVRETDARVEAARARSVETMGLRARTQTAIETLAVNIANIDAQLEKLYARQEAENARRNELAGELDELRRRETERQSEAGALAEERRAAAEHEAAAAKRVVELNEQWQSLREKKSSLEGRLNSLRELRDSYEGFASGVKAIMTAKQQPGVMMEGIIGPVGDLVSADQRYERAIEAALGGNVNNVVVENADVAKSAIGFLKENRAGRVTFLPLDTIRPGHRDDVDAFTGRPGIIGPAMDYARFDGRLTRAMQYLFHNTVIVETIDAAIAIARSNDRYPRMVTLDGEVVSPAGAVTGGSTKHEGRGVLGRSAEIADLEERLEELTRSIGAVAEQGREAVAVAESAKARAADLADQERGAREALNEVSTEIAWRTTELTNLTDSTGALERERDAFLVKRGEYEAERRNASERATTMETEDEALQRSIAEARDEASHARHGQSELTSALSDARVELAELTQNLEEIERDRIRLEREHSQALGEAGRRVTVIEELKANQVSLDNETKDHIERSKALSEDKEEARKKVVEAENERQKVLNESEGIEKQLKSLREHLREAQTSVHKIEIELRHDEDQLEFFQERILTEYNIALAALKAEDVGEDELGDDERERMVKDIRTKLDRMGSVNLMAIEEFDALTERHDFLKTQFDDLTNAREALLNVVARIDETIREMFLDTFNAVAENFRQYFRQLFNGGQARVYLIDEADPLESGIEIEARPPGKKPQTISLLSGGEQAMTAIALLFGIFKAKPSPFCVLDEVDAPLDDANVVRFINLLDEFADQSQFIVITHNKQTMARASALYGVTQQERGVSQLVSVRFKGVEKESAA